ncbi:MAG TPA: metal ABC transporter substrate-binding protein [Phycisphaerales bacterium]|nr:metal ABC transporter substrate-binding protein [Phycisphaerales bacterium]
MRAASISRFLLLLTVCLSVTGLAGCSRSGPKREADGRKKVVTTFTVLADIARNVAGDAAVVESITKPGAEIHDYEPTPGDIVKAQSADLVLVNGLGLERWFERFMGKVKDVPTALLSAGVEPVGITTGPYNGKPNPHAWMSPANAVKYVANIRDALVKLDPANAAVYTANAERYTAQIMEVDRALRAALIAIPAEQRVLVSSEGAFSYLCRDYGLRELYLWPVNADEEGTPQQVQAVINGVRAVKVPVCFSESTISDKAMRQVCKETGARYGGVLYVDSLTDADGPAPSYLALLRFNADTIIKGFGVQSALPAGPSR